jgi:hypothetical protein
LDTSNIVIELGGIRVTTTVIQELEVDGTPIVTVRRSEITALRLDRGYVSERPLASLTFGLFLLVLGFLVAGGVLRSLLFRDVNFGRRAAYLLTGCAISLGMGLWLARHAVRQGPFVGLVLRSDNRKLAFRADTSADEIDQFADALSQSPYWANSLNAPATPQSSDRQTGSL